MNLIFPLFFLPFINLFFTPSPSPFLSAIIDQAAAQTELESICSFCSRMKRGRLYSAARREGYNVLAFGQHLDDLSERY